MFGLDTFLTNKLDFTNTIIPRAQMARSESVAHGASNPAGWSKKDIKAKHLSPVKTRL